MKNKFISHTVTLCIQTAQVFKQIYHTLHLRDFLTILNVYLDINLLETTRNELVEEDGLGVLVL